MSTFFEPGESISVQHRLGQLIAGRTRLRHDCGGTADAYLFLGRLSFSAEAIDADGHRRHNMFVSLGRVNLRVRW